MVQNLNVIVNCDIKNNTIEGDNLYKFIIKNVFKKFIKNKSYGTQDGGCLIFAIFMKEICDKLNLENSIVLFSRNKVIEDHFVLKVNSSKYGLIFIDSDGIHTKDDMINKLKYFEFLDTYLVEDIDISKVKIVEKDPVFTEYLIDTFSTQIKDILKTL